MSRPRIPAFRAALLASAALGIAARAAAQCDLPLVVSSAATTANVLIVLDTSGSMNEVVTHPAYHPATTYSGNFTSSSSYNVASDASYTPRSFNSGWPNTPSAYLVNSDAGASGTYSGNYLNWVFFHATAEQRAAIPAYTRIQAGKSVVNQVLTNVTNVRFAIEIFNGDNGGTILAPFGTAIATMQSSVNALRADSYTPLAETMEDALDYFRQTGSGAPIQAACQKSFAILITDGFPTRDVDVSSYLRSNDCGGNDAGANCVSLGTGFANDMDCSAYLDNVTCYLYDNDLRTDLAGVQNVSTYVIGFNIDAPLLETAAAEGGGEYYTVSDATGLVSALTATLNSINRRVAAGAAVAVVGAEDRSSNRLFRARYETGTWRGFVESFALPYTAGDAAQWEAGARLAARSADSRTVVTTTDGSTLTSFTSGNATLLRSALNAANDTEASNLIRFIRGDSIAGMRGRGGWKLGDIVDAAPVAVGKPTGQSHLAGYSAFRAANLARPEVLYVASNDGMLHCFDAATGDELWAYVPRAQLPRLHALANPGYCHQFFVNVTPAVYDVKIGTAWKTVLFGGQDGGTSAMFALDVTDPASVSLLWDRDVPGLKGSWNPPTLVRDRHRNGFVLAVGTGYSAASSADSLLVLDPADGSVLSRLALGPAVAGNKTTRANVLDMDFDGWDDRLYLGDLSGRVYRVNLAANPWTRTEIFRGSEPVQAMPILTLDALARPMLFFGTGQFITATDPTSTASRAIYGVVDDGTSATVTPADLVNQTSTIQAMGGARGWYVTLANASGERVTRSAALIAGTLYVPSFRPSTASCADGTVSWLYTLDWKDGSAPDFANGAANNVTNGRSQSTGDGMLSEPTADLVNEVLLLQSSNGGVLTRNLSGGLKKLVVRGWHQKWN